MTPIEQARLDKTLEEAAAAKLRRLRDEGRLHDVDSCRHRRLRQIAAVRQALNRLPREVAAELPDPYRRQIERRGRAAVRGILEAFAAEPEAGE